MGRTREFDVDAAVLCAMELFWAQGYEGTSTRDLTTQIGIGPGSLYAAFGSKEGLFVAALDRYHEHFGDLVHAARTAAAEGGPVRPIIMDLLMGMLGRTVADRPEACLLIKATVERAATDPEVAQRVRAALNGLHDAITELLGLARARGELHAEADAGDLARAVLAVFIGTRILRAADPDPARARATLEAALVLLA
jgi:TetR/AcrR family transcriptional repressor of nem operon